MMIYVNDDVIRTICCLIVSLGYLYRYGDVYDDKLFEYCRFSVIITDFACFDFNVMPVLCC